MTERLALVSLVLLLAAPAAAAPLAHREVLPNGIVLLVAERPAIPLVAVRVLMRAGAALDPPDRAGLASLTGALLTRGTSKRTGPALDAAIEFVGGSLEAGAGRDSLNVSLRVLRKDLGLGLDLLADVLLSPAFPAPEVTRKVAELKAAIKRSEEDPAAVASRALARLVYPGHPYGVPVEGTLESADRLTREDVQGFWRAHARPDTTVIAVVGQVTVAEARREILARLGGWQRPAAAPATVPEATPGAAPREETIARELTQATIMFGRQAIRQTSPDYFPLVVAAYVLGGGSTSRLYTRVRDQAGLAYSIYSFASPSRYGASLIVAAQTRTAEVPRVIAMVREELARMGREPVTEHELELAKAYLIGSFPLRLDTSGKVADFVVAVEELGLGLDYADRYRARVAQVTAADVQRVARQYFAPDTFSRVVVGRSP
ncbi:MAG: insulinase family protein [Candidatus Rokubacteria bacterium]|nr:insulinase family protein [Candidatus Rokubacteria bacterium]